MKYEIIEEDGFKYVEAGRGRGVGFASWLNGRIE